MGTFLYFEKLKVVGIHFQLFMFVLCGGHIVSGQSGISEWWCSCCGGLSLGPDTSVGDLVTGYICHSQAMISRKDNTIKVVILLQINPQFVVSFHQPNMSP